MASSLGKKLFAFFLLVLAVVVSLLFYTDYFHSEEVIPELAMYPDRLIGNVTHTMETGHVAKDAVIYDVFGQWKSEKKLHLEKDKVIEVQNITEMKSENSKKDVKKYAVISASTPQGLSQKKYNYVFCLPLTVMAWYRIGYDTIILISGSEKHWQREPVLALILSYLKDLKAHLHFLETKDENLVMISQTSRLFASCIMGNLKADDIVITSDSDLWPLNSEMYVLPEDNKLMVLNAYCCGDFKYKEGKFQMHPIANIATSVKTWRTIMQQEYNNRTCPSNSAMILDYFSEEFGKLATVPVSKGENDGWYLDQHMISIRIEQWMRTLTDKSGIHFVSRNVHRDRLDRSAWQPRRLGAMTDSHLLENLYEVAQWVKVQPLLIMMYGDASTYFTLCQRYREEFMAVLIENTPTTTRTTTVTPATSYADMPGASQINKTDHN